jgi:peptidoglycan/xylan/chitin deacetylase (PgdA/CDA1 family)
MIAKVFQAFKSWMGRTLSRGTIRATYLLRFDDICATMNWKVWDQIEDILLKNDIKPILAVVPDNQDKKLQVNQANPQFWDRVRRWQKLGWTIGIHGYQHLYTTFDPGIIGLNKYSEFSGLPASEQKDKIQKGMEIFKREGVHPEVWIAPAHSFDQTTITVLKNSGIRVISDGYFLFPHLDSNGMMWIPQQLWKFYYLPFGIWTIGFHHNAWSETDLSKFHEKVQSYKESFASLDEIAEEYRECRRNWFDPIFSRFYLVFILLKKSIRNLLRSI